MGRGRVRGAVIAQGLIMSFKTAHGYEAAVALWLDSQGFAHRREIKVEPRCDGDI